MIFPFHFWRGFPLHFSRGLFISEYHFFHYSSLPGTLSDCACETSDSVSTFCMRMATCYELKMYLGITWCAWLSGVLYAWEMDLCSLCTGNATQYVMLLNFWSGIIQWFVVTFLCRFKIKKQIKDSSHVFMCNIKINDIFNKIYDMHTSYDFEQKHTCPLRCFKCDNISYKIKRHMSTSVIPDECVVCVL